MTINNMTTRFLATATLFALAATGIATAQPASTPEISRLASQVSREIGTLSNYGVFDHISFSLNPTDAGYQVTLHGFASRPTLAKSAARVVKNIESIAAVENKIQVLPASRFDEDIRLRTYLQIYNHPQLSRYSPNRGAPVYGSLSAWRKVADLGISQDPPLGRHPISIIVENGRVTLEGSVDSEMDKQIARMQANQVPGVFQVTNNLTVASGR